MKYVTHNEKKIVDLFSSYKGEMSISYAELVKKFGEPKVVNSGKIDVCWDIEFENGIKASIYNWKNGKNYVKDFVLENNTKWTIGAQKSEALTLIKEIWAEKH